MRLPVFLSILIALGIACAVDVVAQNRTERRHARAKPPKFDPEEEAGIFFDDVFSQLVGKRPARSPRGGSPASSTAGMGVVRGPEAVQGSTVPGGWSQIISATSIEDEIKLLKLKVDKTVTTPSSFAGQGHSVARLDFTLLAMLFGIIERYDADVRWKDSAPLARELFARTASNLKAGGSIQVYNESKKRKQDLDDLVRGSRLLGTSSEQVDWSSIVDRAPLMELLDGRFEPNLKAWTSSDGEFKSHQEQLAREAELVGVIGAVLVSEGMDDADDEEYRGYAESLKTGGLELARAALAADAEAAREAMVTLSRSCTDCHDIYR